VTNQSKLYSTRSVVGNTAPICHASFAKVAIAGKLRGSMAQLGNMLLSGNSTNCTIVVGRNLIWSIIISPHKMSNEKHSGGRPPAKILTDNFTELEKVNNKSCQKFWKCNYCTATTGNGQHIEGRDNCCLLHLTNPKDCPDAPQFVCNEAWKALMQKGTAIGQTEVPLFWDTTTFNGPESNGDSRSGATTSSTVAVKKRKSSGTLDNYVDCGMNPTQQETAYLKLFW
jgi:hypothetical protein